MAVVEERKLIYAYKCIWAKSSNYSKFYVYWSLEEAKFFLVEIVNFAGQYHFTFNIIIDTTVTKEMLDHVLIPTPSS